MPVISRGLRADAAGQRSVPQQRALGDVVPVAADLAAGRALAEEHRRVARARADARAAAAALGDPDHVVRGLAHVGAAAVAAVERPVEVGATRVDWKPASRRPGHFMECGSLASQLSGPRSSPPLRSSVDPPSAVLELELAGPRPRALGDVPPAPADASCPSGCP